MKDEGYIKFNFEAIEEVVLSHSEVEDLIDLRTKLYDIGLIGFSDGVSFGNVSKRANGDEFVISSSNTGDKRILSPEQFALVTFVDLDRNMVKFKGKNPPSSETLTHYSVYKAFPEANYVVHFHNHNIWEYYLDKLPTTPKSAGYGTTELAKSILELRANFHATEKISAIILGGHYDGVVTFGRSVDEVLDNINKLYRKEFLIQD
jgi:ribulose-5-phosphate 4-epimerase/fuculose-1-phosphate aldolase